MHLKITAARWHIIGFNGGRQTVPAVLRQVEVNTGQDDAAIWNEGNTAQQFCDGFG